MTDDEKTGPTTITLANPNRDARKFVPGMQVVFSAGPARWWVRLWRWLTRWKPGTLTVVDVDHEHGVLTVDASGPGKRS